MHRLLSNRRGLLAGAAPVVDVGMSVGVEVAVGVAWATYVRKPRSKFDPRAVLYGPPRLPELMENCP
jgi:hypothetical protein